MLERNGTILDEMFELEDELREKRRWMTDMVGQGKSEVANIYEGAVVLVTGGSGFLGKQLIEKLLRSCRVAKIYVLLRAKKGKKVEERLQVFVQEKAFDSLREEQPNFAERIFTVEGDVGELRIGINEQDWKNISDEVNFIFHVAASTNFELPLKLATLINVRGTREVINLAKECKHLKSMVYVSTAYTHATKSRIDGDVYEEFYQCPVPVNAMIQLAETADQEILDGIMNVFKKEWPNSYAFTKAIAEEAVRTMSEDLPVCVVRPAVVTGAANEPSAGWLDFNAIYSVSGLFFGMGYGLIHLFYTDMNKVIDFVPVDYTNNATIVAAAETMKRHANGDKGAKIYTISNIRNPSDKRLLEDTCNTTARGFVPSGTIWYPCALMVKNKQLFNLLTWIFHYIPAIPVDAVLSLMGSKIRLLRLYKKAYIISIGFHHFVQNDFRLSDHNTLKLFENLSSVDKDIFHFDMQSIKWNEYYTKWLFGVRKYLMFGDLKDTPYAIRKQFWLRIIHYIVLPLYIYLWYKIVLFVLFFVFSFVKMM